MNIPGENLQQSGCAQALPPEVRTGDIPLGAGAANVTPVIRTDDVPHVGRMETVPAATPPDLGRMSPDSPLTVAYDDVVHPSMPISPNRVQVGRSLDVSDEFQMCSNVSPVTPGFLM